MVAGASGIDLFLLVVAADDGVMPQTVERLAVIELLGVERGVVALTKADLVDEELLELARADVEAVPRDHAVRDAPIVVVSARDGRGLPELLDTLARVAGEVEAGAEGRPGCRWTGCSSCEASAPWSPGRSGAAPSSVGDRLIVQPGGDEGDGAQRADARPAGRDGAGRTSRCPEPARRRPRDARARRLSRGSPGRRALPPTRSFAAAVRLVGGARALKTGERVRLHHGTAAHVAHLTFLDRRELDPGEDTVAVVRLDGGPAAVEPHDRFMLRSLSPVQTIGGGDRARRCAAALARSRRPARLSEGRRRWRRRRACLLAAADRGPAGLAAADLVAADIEPDAAARTLAALARAGELETVGAARRAGE